MKKSTRALVGMVVLDIIVLAGGGYMAMQTASGAWPVVDGLDPAREAADLWRTTGMGVGVITALLLAAFFYHRSKGN